jgi:hypothetical protein
MTSTLEALQDTLDAAWMAVSPTGHRPDGELRLPEVVAALVAANAALARQVAQAAPPPITPRPDHVRGCVVHVTLQALGMLLQLPPEAQLDGVFTDPSEPGRVLLRLRGVGKLVPYGSRLPQEHARAAIHACAHGGHSVAWNFDYPMRQAHEVPR